LDVIERLQVYTKQIEQNTLDKRTDTAFFFPSSRKQHTAWHNSTIYILFRKLLYQCGISHGGRGKGPRVHDLRHTFAVNRLTSWYRENKNVQQLLPILSVYLGHKHLAHTTVYLTMTDDLLQEAKTRFEKFAVGEQQ
jgi:integrase